ncbi:hypothetical protein [Micromonospora aurantiaca]|uniref:hypothetical protein n=1 Tax=Micromonospora aurantiaca (nom. illeg.) TaxID=47850 RepID=UPI0011CDD536|nr:hypothetical protein [Micromonospora aurantiaca]
MTRVYLALTGYPRIGGDVLHIAHALWGGLLLFAGCLLPLLLVNRSALSVAAVLTGIGVGLFVDEVDKFITVDNDYFFPAAAPIAYAVFLLTVFVGVRVVRHSPHAGARTELHAALELLSGALDADLTAAEQSDLGRRLRAAAADTSAAPDLRRLAAGLLVAVSAADSASLHLAVSRPGPVQRLRHRVEALAGHWLSERRLRLALAGVLGLLGLLAVSDLTVITTVAADLADGTTSEVTDVANRFARVRIEDTRGVSFLLVRAGLDVLVGVALLTAAVLLMRDKRRVGAELAAGSLLLALTVVNLLVFYLEQFLAAVGAWSPRPNRRAASVCWSKVSPNRRRCGGSRDRAPGGSVLTADVSGGGYSPSNYAPLFTKPDSHVKRLTLRRVKPAGQFCSPSCCAQVR